MKSQKKTGTFKINAAGTLSWTFNELVSIGVVIVVYNINGRYQHVETNYGAGSTLDASSFTINGNTVSWYHGKNVTTNDIWSYAVYAIGS